ncbi:MAG: tRNA (guanosine(37)-N1)-methyltransferase TrmD [Pseudomonadales bacterium]|jgi:tRNA (guanine37-N1)-methyltransferase|nr:tRNA (guanosine(37)-N1)-methyltransferase TrmD [Pseudomonadales bacterium]
MQIAIVTLFPGMFSALTEYGISARAVQRKLVSLRYYSPRDYTQDRHRTVDDKPYGGGPGMLMKTGPVSAAIRAAKAGQGGRGRVLYLSPQGRPLTQTRVSELAREPALVLLCGRYEGIDERVLTSLVDEECSLGDFVLSGGEVAAMALLDALIRLQPGALGAQESAAQDSFADSLLDHPHYTRPEEFEGQTVPPVLLSGDHARIARWRLQQRLGATWRKRPDLLERRGLSDEERLLLKAYIEAWEAGGAENF